MAALGGEIIVPTLAGAEAKVNVPEGAQSGHWMRSHEFQLQEGDCADYHSLDGVTVDAHVGDANQGNWKL